MQNEYTTNEYILIGLTILGGAFVGWLMNYFFIRRRRDQAKQNNSSSKENDQFVGRMNTASLKKNRVIFSPEVCENEVPKVVASENNDDDEKTESYSESDEQEDEDEQEEQEGEEVDEEEEQMPQFNNRTIKNTQNFNMDTPSTSETKIIENGLSDGDKINATIGKLHGKLATAQLKAKTRQIAAEMSEEEKKYEAQMKNNQMESILKLMMQNQEKFGMSSDDIKEQMNLYNF